MMMAPSSSRQQVIAQIDTNSAPVPLMPSPPPSPPESPSDEIRELLEEMAENIANMDIEREDSIVIMHHDRIPRKQYLLNLTWKDFNGPHKGDFICKEALVVVGKSLPREKVHKDPDEMADNAIDLAIKKNIMDKARIEVQVILKSILL